MINESDNYFIKKGYKSYQGKGNATLDKNRDRPYYGWWRKRMNMYYQYDVYLYARDLIRNRNLESVLDLGCGVAAKFSKLIVPIANRAVGIDQPSAIAYCNKKYSKGLFIADDFDDPSEDFTEKFDLILSVDVIEHLEYPEKFLDYIKRHAHPDTLVLISTVERDLLRGEDCMKSTKAEHIREWNTKELINFLSYSGFEILETHLLGHMKFNFSREYFKKRFSSDYQFNHNLAILCRVKYEC